MNRTTFFFPESTLQKKQCNPLHPDFTKDWKSDEWEQSSKSTTVSLTLQFQLKIFPVGYNNTETGLKNLS